MTRECCQRDDVCDTAVAFHISSVADNRTVEWMSNAEAHKAIATLS